VPGYDGNGRIGLNAHDAPHIQIITQDTNYNGTTEYLRLGEGRAGPRGYRESDGGNHLAYNTRGGSTSSWWVRSGSYISSASSTGGHCWSWG